MKEAGQLVIDAVNAGLAAMHKAPEEELKEAVLSFIKKYGFLGFMTALPTTAGFITYESVYLPQNHFIKEESRRLWRWNYRKDMRKGMTGL